jgi:hypothetical protein
VNEVLLPGLQCGIMSSADLVQVKGWQRSFQPSMKVSMAAMRSVTEVKLPRRMAWPRPFQDHDVSPRMMNGRSIERPAHRVASVTSMRPARRSAPIARLRRAAMTLGPDRVLTLDLSSWYRVSRSQ